MPESTTQPNQAPSLYATRYIQRLLEGCSPANRSDFCVYLSYMAGRSRSTNTAKLAMAQLSTLDRLAGGKALRDLDKIEWTVCLAQYAGTHKGGSTQTLAAYAKAFLAWAHGGKCPEDIKHVLRVGKPKDKRNVICLTEAERDSLLSTAALGHDRRSVARSQALLWILWDTGFRVSEALGLRVGSVLLDDKGGAQLCLPADAPDLKTGPRTIYVMDCVPALKVWLAYHPYLSEPNAPLFQVRASRSPLRPHSVTKLLLSLGAEAQTRRIWPHLFRHTRCTRAARGDPIRGIAGWNDAQMRAYFGWEPGSDMPAHYSHLAHRDMEERVRADAGADPLAARIREDPLAMLASLAGMVAARTLDEAEKRAAISVRPRRNGLDGSPAPALASP